LLADVDKILEIFGGNMPSIFECPFCKSRYNNWLTSTWNPESKIEISIYQCKECLNLFENKVNELECSSCGATDLLNLSSRYIPESLEEIINYSCIACGETFEYATDITDEEDIADMQNIAEMQREERGDY
jgi:transcription elongation factor Elf1